MKAVIFSLLFLIPGILFCQHQPPEITYIPDIQLSEGENKQIIIQATDPDNQLVIDNPSIVILGSSTAEGDKATDGNAWRERLYTFLSQNLSSFSLNRKTFRGHTSYHKMPSDYIPPPDRPYPHTYQNITASLDLQPDIILVNLPSNDVALYYELQETITNFKVIKNEAENQGVKIFFTTTQPRNFSDFERRKALQDKAKVIQDTFGTQAINIYDPMVNYADLRMKDEYNADDIHPNDEGHRVIFELILQHIDFLLLKDTVGISVSNLPLFAEFTDNMDGTASLTFNPGFGDAGVYEINVIAFDNDSNQSSTNFLLQVNTPIIKNVDQNAFEAEVKIDENGTIFYGLYQHGSTPAIADIESGTGEGILQHGSVAGNAANIIFADLLPNTSYEVFIFAEDDEPVPNKQSAPFHETVTTNPLDTDLDPPLFSNNPVVDTLNSGSVTLSFSINEPGKLYWSLFPEGKYLPTTEEVESGANSIQNDSMLTNGSPENFEIKGLIAEKTYELFLIAKDNAVNPNVQENPFIVTFTTLSSSTGDIPEQTILINPTVNSAPSVEGWNNLDFVNVSTGDNFFMSLGNQEGMSTEIGLILYHGTNGSFLNKVANNYGGLNGGIFPDPVANYASYTSGAAKFSLINLDPQKYYSLTFYGGRSVTGSRISEYIIGEHSQLLESANNKTETSCFEKISPESNGTINFEMRKYNSSWAYLNALKIDVYSGLISDQQAPEPVTGIMGIYNDSVKSNMISWNENSEQDLSAYNIYRSLDQHMLINDSTLYRSGVVLNEFQDKFISSNSTYYYLVTAVDINGNESVPSSPDKPQELSGVALDKSSISLTWRASQEADFAFYQIYRSKSKININDTINLVGVTSENSFLDTLLEEKTTYAYQVFAVDSSQNRSEGSDIIIVQTLDETAPATPSNLQVASNGIDFIEIIWESVTTEDLAGYKVYKNLNAGFPVNSENFITMVSSEMFMDMPLDTASIYYYKII